MANLHVIYDPTERLETRSEHLPKSIKIATMPISDDLSSNEIHDVCDEIITILLEQLRIG